MAARGIFESLVSDDGSLAGVFEDDKILAYFYLCEVGDDEGGRILDHIHIYSGDSGLHESEVTLRWDGHGKKVGLFIRGELWAYFDCVTRQKCGGKYTKGAIPEISRPASFSN